MRIVKRTLGLIGAAVVAAGLSGCTRLGYYAHVAGGQLELLRAREPIDRILADPARDTALKERLRTVQAARAWAIDRLQMPANGSYTQYADLGRPYAVWNVFATPELSLQPLQHCFPFAGCLAYQGYYSREKALARAQTLIAQGYDAYVGGVPAYSTLGWFADPVLNTMMHWSDAVLVGTLFHELAHQKLYVRDDSRFNESYASFVERQGLAEYVAEQPQIEPVDPELRHRRWQFVRLMLDARKRLEALYAQPLDDEAKRVRKAEEFQRLRSAYEQLRDTEWSGDPGYDRWFEDGVPNNARLLPFGLYDEYIPAFAALFEQEQRDWGRFHAAAKRLSQLDAAARDAEMDRLLRSRTP